MPFSLNKQICNACITVTQLVHSKTASKLAAPIKIIINQSCLVSVSSKEAGMYMNYLDEFYIN